MKVITSIIKAISAVLGIVTALFGALMLFFEVMVWFPDNSRAYSSLGQVWFQNDPFANLVGTPSLPLFGAIIERRISPTLWDPFLVTILAWPSWMALLFVAVFSLLLSSIFIKFSKSGTKPDQKPA